MRMRAAAALIEHQGKIKGAIRIGVALSSLSSLLPSKRAAAARIDG
jgi:hypothetical protein